MPNTPAAISQGITAIVANDAAGAAALDEAEALLSVGDQDARHGEGATVVFSQDRGLKGPIATFQRS